MRPVSTAPPPSLWQAEMPSYAASGRAELPAEADVVIVGGGLIGSSLALALAETGRRPLVVERERLGAGASGRNGGLLLPGTAELYPRLVARWGRPLARELWTVSVAGAARLVRWIADHDVDCAFRPDGGLHVASSPDEGARLRQMAMLLAEDGFAATWLTREALAGWTSLHLPPDMEGACLIPGGGPLHSGRLLAGLAQAAARLGARFVEGVTVNGIRGRRKRQNGLVVSCSPGGAEMRASHVILCTNAWTARVLPTLKEVITPVRGQVMCTAPLPTGRFRGAWSMNDGYEYLQQLPDGRLVVGGLRWRADDLEIGYDRPDLNEAIQAQLLPWLSARFPELGRVDGLTPAARRWAGIMAFTADRLPLIGPLAGTDGRLWLAAGFNGHGLPFAGLAAALIVAGLAGQPLPGAADAFDPGRFTIRPNEHAV